MDIVMTAWLLLLFAADPVTDEAVRLQALAAAFPGMSVAVVPGKTVDSSLASPGQAPSLVFP